MSWRIIVMVITILLGVYIGYLMHLPVSAICEKDKCPYCYGDDLCKDVEERKINLVYETFSDLFYNLLSVKNVYFAEYEGIRVVLKKLAHQKDLNRITPIDFLDEDTILNSIRDGFTDLKTCNNKTGELFLETIRKSFTLEQIWTILSANPEPLILTVFRKNDGWPVPELHGACGLLIAETYCGHPLDHFESSTFSQRAFLASQLLQAAVNFTLRHENFGLYLTDISPDNVAVDDDFNLCFIDLGNVILKRKQRGDRSVVHYSEHFEDEDFVYSEEAICGSPVSDHNVYAVCKLLLSRKAPWPMMTEGLLHSPPDDLVFHYGELFALIEECVESKEKLSRFYIAEELIKLLNEAARL